MYLVNRVAYQGIVCPAFGMTEVDHIDCCSHLQEAEEQLNQGKIGNIPEASALTHKQVLEMAVAEASRRVHEATKYALMTAQHC